MDPRLEQELKDVRELILSMGKRVEEAFEKALQALSERDTKLAEEVIEGDGAINQLECDVDEKVLTALALGEPVAKDLRLIVGSARIAMNLERVGDEAVNICERVMVLANRPELPCPELMVELGQLAKQMLAASLDAYRTDDTDGALEVCDMETRSGEVNMKVLKKNIDFMLGEQRAIERSVHAIIASRSLERVANQAANVAENVVFITKGVNMKHQCGRI